MSSSRLPSPCPSSPAAFLLPPPPAPSTPAGHSSLPHQEHLYPSAAAAPLCLLLARRIQIHLYTASLLHGLGTDTVPVQHLCKEGALHMYTRISHLYGRRCGVAMRKWYSRARAYGARRQQGKEDSEKSHALCLLSLSLPSLYAPLFLLSSLSSPLSPSPLSSLSLSSSPSPPSAPSSASPAHSGVVLTARSLVTFSRATTFSKARVRAPLVSFKTSALLSSSVLCCAVLCCTGRSL